MSAILVRSARINLVGASNIVTLQVLVDRSLASAGGPAAGVVASGAVTKQGYSYILPALTLYSTVDAPDLVTQGAIFTANLLDGDGNVVTALPGFGAFQLRVPNSQTTWNEIRQLNDFLRQSPGLPPPGSPSWLGDDTNPTYIQSIVTVLGMDSQAGQDTIELLFGNSDNPPGFRINVTSGLMEYSNNGINWFTFTGGGGSLSGSGTANYLAMWTGATTLGNSPAFYDAGTQTLIVQNNLAAEKQFTLGSNQVIFNGDPARAVNAIQGLLRGVTGQTGDFLRAVDDTGTVLFRVRTLGNVTIRGLNYAWPSANGAGVLTNDGSGNLTWTPAAGGTLSGSGTVNYLSMWTGTTALGNSPAFYDSGTQTVIVQNNLAAEKQFTLGSNQVIFNGDPARAVNVIQGLLRGVTGQTGDFLRAVDDTGTVLFRVRTLGNVTIRGLNYAWPSANGAGVLTNDGSGNLTWTPAAGGGNVSGSGTVNYLPIWTGANTLGDSPAFYDAGTQTVIVQNNLAAEKQFTLGSNQVIFNGDPARAVNVIQGLLRGVAGQTGDFLRAVDDTGTVLFRVRTLGNVTIRGLNYAWPSANAVGVLTNDGSGNLTWTPAAGSTTFQVAGDSGPAQTISNGDTLTLVGGNGLASVASAVDTVTFNLDLASAQAGVPNASSIIGGQLYSKPREFKTVRAVNANTAIVPSTDNVLVVDTAGGPVTVTLTTPGATDPRDFHIKKKTTDANAITLVPASGQIDNAANFTFNGVIGTSGESRHVVWDGTNWWIL